MSFYELRLDNASEITRLQHLVAYHQSEAKYYESLLARVVADADAEYESQFTYQQASDHEQFYAYCSVLDEEAVVDPNDLVPFEFFDDGENEPDPSYSFEM